MPTMPKNKRAPWMPPPRKWNEHTNRWEGYNTRKWREAREAFLMTCLFKCATVGCNNPASSVDHIKPFSSGHDPWDQSNWQALCKRCHAIKSSSEGGRAAAGRGETTKGEGIGKT